MVWRTWFRKSSRRSALVTLESTGQAGALDIHIVTDVGNIRANNEDWAAAVYPEDECLQGEKGVMLVLADGMGGHNSGEVASRMAVNRVAQVFFDTSGPVPDRLREAFHITNAEIYRAGQTEINKGMGTTCTAVVTLGADVYVAHVGDSRAYCLNDGQLIPLTTDQTYVQYLIQKGTIGLDEAMKHPKRNLLMQALGASATVAPEISQRQGYLAPDNVIMLCSDGLYEYLADKEIAAYLNDDAKQRTTAQDLVAEAKRRGGHDNITVLLGRVQPPGNERALKATTELLRNSTSNR